MDIWDINKLVLFIGFVVPGFITLKTYAVVALGNKPDSAQQVIDAISYSCVNYALLLWPIYEVENRGLRTTAPTLYILFWVFVLLIAPVAWAFIFCRVRSTRWAQAFLPHPIGKPWDYVFAQRKSYWVLVTLKGGKRIGGFYGSSSFTSSSPFAEQIYLEQCWHINDDSGFERMRINSAGLIILTSDLESVELFNVDEGSDNGEIKPANDDDSSSYKGLPT